MKNCPICQRKTEYHTCLDSHCQEADVAANRARNARKGTKVAIELSKVAAEKRQIAINVQEMHRS